MLHTTDKQLTVHGAPFTLSIGSLVPIPAIVRAAALYSYSSTLSKSLAGIVPNGDILVLSKSWEVSSGRIEVSDQHYVAMTRRRALVLAHDGLHVAEWVGEASSKAHSHYVRVLLLGRPGMRTFWHASSSTSFEAINRQVAQFKEQLSGSRARSIDPASLAPRVCFPD